VYQAGTLSGNPVAMAAGLATLAEISVAGFHAQLTAKTQALIDGLRQAASDTKTALLTNHVCGMFGFFFSSGTSMERFSQVMTSDAERFKRFFHAMLQEGVYLAPSAFEAGFMSIAHSEADIAATVTAARRAFVGSR
jgi:glutamate-1-semialdehyde 2,1-aminomutase